MNIMLGLQLPGEKVRVITYAINSWRKVGDYLKYFNRHIVTVLEVNAPAAFCSLRSRR